METWYYEHELPQYAKLFDQYWETNWEEDHLERNGGEEANSSRDACLNEGGNVMIYLLFSFLLT